MKTSVVRSLDLHRDLHGRDPLIDVTARSCSWPQLVTDSLLYARMPVKPTKEKTSAFLGLCLGLLLHTIKPAQHLKIAGDVTSGLSGINTGRVAL